MRNTIGRFPTEQHNPYMLGNSSHRGHYQLRDSIHRDQQRNLGVPYYRKLRFHVHKLFKHTSLQVGGKPKS